MPLKLLKAEEVILLRPLIQEFFDEGNIYGTFNPEHAAKVVSSQIGSGIGFCYYQGSPILGAIAGVMYQDFGTGDLCCAEFFWYVTKKARGGSLGMRLFKAFDQEALNRGAKRILMMHIVTTPERDKTLENIYESNGYALKERVYAKNVVN